MYNFIIFLFSLFFISESWAWNQYEWQGNPMVLTVGTQGCAKTICTGTARRDLVGIVGDPEISYNTGTCGAVSDGNGGFTCPPAQECMDESTPGISVAKFSSIKSKKRPVILEMQDKKKPTQGNSLH